MERSPGQESTRGEEKRNMRQEAKLRKLSKTSKPGKLRK